MAVRKQVEVGVPAGSRPRLDEEGCRLLEEAEVAAAVLSLHLKARVLASEHAEQLMWLDSGGATALFQPWSMEIMFATGLHDDVRFSEFQALLGISPRTLSARLRELQKDGFLERQVHDETPVRITYSLSEHGRRTIRAAIPLVVYLHQHQGGRE